MSACITLLSSILCPKQRGPQLRLLVRVHKRHYNITIGQFGIPSGDDSGLSSQNRDNVRLRRQIDIFKEPANRGGGLVQGILENLVSALLQAQKRLYSHG